MGLLYTPLILLMAGMVAQLIEWCQAYFLVQVCK